MQNSQLPAKWFKAFAVDDPNKVEIPVTTAAPDRASQSLGFPPLTMQPPESGGVPPQGEDFNGAMNQLARFVRWYMAGGALPFDSTYANNADIGGYPQGSAVTAADLLGQWLSTADNNIINPDTVGTGWVPGYAYGNTPVATTGGTTTLTPAQAVKPSITVTGALVSNATLVVPNWVRQWNVINSTSGAFTLTVKTAAGAGVTVLQGSSAHIICDGTICDYVGKSGATGVQFANNTNYATQAFVQRALGNLAGRINATTTQTLPASAAGNAINLGVAASHTVTLPLSTAVPPGAVLLFEGGSNTNTINVQGADTIGTGIGSQTSITLAANETLWLESNNLGQWVMVGGSGQLPYSSLFGFTLGINSYQKLPSGKIQVNGTFTASGTPGNPVAVTFPISAANGRNLLLTPTGASGTAVSAWFDSLTGSGFNGRCSVAGAIVHYQAIIDG